MAEDSSSSATDAAAALESYYDFSIVQPHDHEYDGEADIRLTGSSSDLSSLQNVSASTTTRGKGRLDSLKENMYKQQERLTALKERARRSQDGRRTTSSMSDSVESLKTLGPKLTVLKSRANDASTPLATPTKDFPSPDVSLFQTSGSEKLLMLTQRTEQNRALLEQRKRDMAKSLLSVKAQGRSSLGPGPELGSGSSMTDLRQAANPPVSRHRSALDLEAELDENRVKMLKSRMKLTELKQSRQEQELQEQRTELTRRAQLIEQLELSGAELQRTLTQRNEELEQLRLSQREREEESQREKEETREEVEDSLQEQENSRLQGEVLVLRERLAELENVNDLLETTRGELQEELSTAREREREKEREQERKKEQEREQEQEREREREHSKPQAEDAQVSLELAKQLQELSHQQAELQAINEELRREAAAQKKLPVTDASISERLEELETTIASQSSQLEEQRSSMAAQSEELAEKTTELNVLHVNLRLLEEKLAQSSRSKPLFLEESTGSQEELQQLKQKLDDSNKANIKLKLKCKQAEKQLQKIQAQEGQKELKVLEKENEELQQRITVLEDEKGQWQLASMEKSQQEEEEEPERSQSLKEEEQERDSSHSSQLEAIRLLEEQKLELQQALVSLQQGHESARVESELSEAQLEEHLTQRVQQLELEAQEHRQQLESLQSEKESLDKKLSHYISENMELLDKLEKLSSSSSAESIEIVERQQLDPPVLSQVSELTQTDQDPASSESLSQLRERLELYTQERGEVLDKLEQLSAENAQLQRERDHLLSSTSTSSNLSQELSSMQRSSEVVASLDAGDGGPALFDKCEKSLSKLNSELEAYRRANDRQAKFNVSKKLAKEAKNCHTQLSELLHKVKEASTAVETVTVVETVVAVTAPNGKALAEYEQLTAQNGELKAEISRLRRELEEFQEREPDAGDRESLLAIAAGTEETQARQQRQQQEEDYLQLQSLLEDARNAQEEQRQQIEEQLDQIRELRQSEADHLQLLARQREELTQHQLQAEQFDQLLNSKEMSHEKQLEQHTRLRRELESRSDSLEGELSILQALVAEQKQQLIESLSESEHSLNLKMLELQAAREELAELRSKSEDPEQLREALRISKSLAAQQVSELGARQETIDALNQQIQELYQGLEQDQLKNRELREKLKKYALNLKKRGQENVELEKKVKDLESQVQELQEVQEQPQVVELEKKVQELTAELQELQTQQSDSQQLEQLKEELKAKIHVNLENRDALRQLREQVQEQEQLLEQRDAELQSASLESKELRRERQEAEQEVYQQGQENAKLREEVSKLSQELQESSKLREELEELRRQLESKSTKFDKSKELIKHRNATIQGLQRELQQLRQPAPDKDKELEQLRREKEALRQELAQREEAISQTKIQSLEAAPSIQAAEEEQHHLRVQLQAAQEQHSLLAQQYARDKADFEVTIARLNTIHEGIQAKLQEDASYIESLETQNSELQARSSALEEQAASQAHQQAEAQDHTQLLERQLREQREQGQQQLHLDQELQQSLQELTLREEEHRRQLELVSKEAEENRELLAGLRVQHEALLGKHAQLEATTQAEREELSNHNQEELAELQQQLAAREAELQRQRQVYDARLAAKASELDELECDLNGHVERATMETRDLVQQLERAQEQIGQRSEELQRLTEEYQEVERERSTLSREVTLLRLQQDSAEQDVLELQELRMQAIQDKTEMDNLRTQIDALCANHSQELQALQQQIAELDTLGQNQTDDQVYIETENKRLTEQLSELQAQLARQHQQQHQAAPQPAPHPAPQLHPAPASLFFGGDALAAPSPFDEIVQPLRVSSQTSAMPPPQPSMDASPTIEDLQRNVSDLEKHAQDLETKLLARNQSLAEHEERRRELEQHLAELERLLREREQQLEEHEERERLAALEKLIQPAAPNHPPAPAAPPTLDMFFGETVTDAVSHQLELGLPQPEPVEEPLIQPKKAYLCQPKQQQQPEQSLQIDWGMDEDPWASAATEAPQTDVEPLHARIAHLEQQLTASEQQKLELQTKTAKLMKRLKEYKTKATVSAPAPAPLTLDNDLDSAIIEELKHQLELHETRQAKAEEQLQQHVLEKEKLTKRIDVLEAGNERMAELKERQDMDVQMYQARIRELQEKVSQLDQWGEVPNQEPASAPAPAPSSLPSSGELESLQAENQELNAECQDLQARLKEERRLVLLAEETAAQSQAQWEQLQEQLKQRQQEELRQQQAQEEIKQELEYLRSCKQQQEEQQLQSFQQIEQEHLRNLQSEVEQLRSLQSEVEQLRSLQGQVEQLQQVQREVEQLRALKLQQDQSQQQLLAEFQQLEAQRLRDQAELEALRQGISSDTNQEHDEQVAHLQEKESEIVHLKQRIEELMREDQTEKLVFEILTKNQELQTLRLQVKQLEEEREQVKQMEEQREEQQPPPASDLDLLRVQCQQLQQEKSDMEEELRVLNNHVLGSLELEDQMKQTLLQLDTKNIEITELRRSLETLQAQTQPDLAAINQQWEQLVEQKCSEVASVWQEHLLQREAAFKEQLEGISQKQQQLEGIGGQKQQLEGIGEQQQQQQQQQRPQEEEANMMLKMQKALETQEMEIVTLKEQLAIRSAEYARLAAQYDPFRLQNRAEAAPTSAGGPPSLRGDEPLPEYVLKADLDYALMMLHQRDMRVEEMILELVQLLEERDHLQLKLSDTLRQLETERSRVSDEASSGSPSKASSAGSSSGEPVATSASSDLKQKLAELQTVKHSKDKAIVDEREQRLQQMLQLQKDMAKQAAGTQVPQADQVDLTQPALRSPSMMLMDWIMGSSKGEEEQQQD